MNEVLPLQLQQLHQENDQIIQFYLDLIKDKIEHIDKQPKYKIVNI